jgi:uncharacterized metal-binding protein YceD (DUF177 family)
MTRPTPEFSRIVDVRYIDAKPQTFTATPEECAALAKRFGLVAIHSLSATLTLNREAAAVQATGRLTAAIVQSCAVSAEDLPVSIDEALTLRFIPEAALEARPDEEVELTESILDEIPYTDDRFDLGEELAQSLALAIDPFAIGPDAAKVRAAGLLTDELSGPFAALAALKKQD